MNQSSEIKSSNSKINLSDFILSCQIIEEMLKRLIYLFSKKINESIVNEIIVYKIDQKKINTLPMGGLIEEFKKYMNDDTIITKLKNLKDKRNKIVHELAFKILEKTNSMKLGEADKDKVMNGRLNNAVNKATDLSDECLDNLMQLLKKL